MYRFALSFTDDYSSAVFVYFLKNESDTTQPKEKFLADTAPCGKIKCMKSDNGTEFMERIIRHFSAKMGSDMKLSTILTTPEWYC